MISCMDFNKEMIFTDELEVKLKDEILNTPEYSSLLEKGANVISQWE